MHFTLEIVDPTALDVFAACQKSLQRFGSVQLIEPSDPPSKVPRNNRPDGFLTVSSPSETMSRYVCEAKQRINPQVLNSAISWLNEMAATTGLKPLLVTEYVNDRASDILREHGISYLDATGNALLVDPPLYIWLRGFRPEQRLSRVSRAFQTTGLRLIAFLLSQPDGVNWPYRKLAAVSGQSLGSTSEILSGLRSLGFIRLARPGLNALVKRRSLFEQWEFGYAAKLRPSLEPQSYRQADATPMEELPHKIPAPMQPDILVGGELAAAVVTNHLRPQGLTLHVRPHRPLLPLVKELRLVPDPRGSVVLLEQFGDTATWAWKDFGPAKLIHPLLIHAELLHGEADDRLRETAQLILSQYIEPTLNNEP